MMDKRFDVHEITQILDEVRSGLEKQIPEGASLLAKIDERFYNFGVAEMFYSAINRFYAEAKEEMKNAG